MGHRRMNKKLKIIAYVVLTVAALCLGVAFRRAYVQVMAPPPDESAPSKQAVAEDATSFHSRKFAQMMMEGAGLFVVLAALGLLTAHDLTHLFADKVEKFMFDDEGETIKTPEYERAEDLWKEGKFLEAIQLMRDHLQEHPREQYVALRIAEIYEKDLGNHLAAALEYEEILRKKLRPERWGWAAIHLANLYSGKLNRVQEAQALLQKIVDEYGQTAAAKKARERLGIPEPVEEAPPEPEPATTTNPGSLEQQIAELHAELQERAKQQHEVETPIEAAPEPEKPVSKLPPGFRPKNG